MLQSMGSQRVEDGLVTEQQHRRFFLSQSSSQVFTNLYFNLIYYHKMLWNLWGEVDESYFNSYFTSY